MLLLPSSRISLVLPLSVPSVLLGYPSLSRILGSSTKFQSKFLFFLFFALIKFAHSTIICLYLSIRLRPRIYGCWPTCHFI